MPNKTIVKEVKIQAPRERVWEVMTKDSYTRQWYEAFSPGSHAETDWKQGSKAVFKDNSGKGIIGFIKTSKPNELIEIGYNGFLDNGKEDYESDYAKSMRDMVERYTLKPSGNGTELLIECDMDDQWYDKMSAKWDEALVILKKLAEN